ncbi:MAG TPA: CRISPR-associated endonuclease Cas1 [Paludibaculum sp.]|jgi:hypothetical protein
MRPLYLAPEREGRAELDGPSLLVKLDGSAGQRFPLRELSRVVVSGRILVQAAAIAACLERGVTMTFLNHDGSPAGWALPEQTSLNPVNENLRNLLEAQHGMERYEDWRRAAERRAMLGVLRRLCIRTARLETESVRAELERCTGTGCGDVGASQWMAWRRGVLSSRVAEWVGGLAVDPRLLESDEAGLPLLRDFGGILSWQIYVDYRMGGPRQPATDEVDRRRAETVEMERLAERDELRIGTLWRRFQVWLKGTR